MRDGRYSPRFRLNDQRSRVTDMNFSSFARSKRQRIRIRIDKRRSFTYRSFTDHFKRKRRQLHLVIRREILRRFLADQAIIIGTARLIARLLTSASSVSALVHSHLPAVKVKTKSKPAQERNANSRGWRN